MDQTKIILVKMPYKGSYYTFYNDLPAGLAILSEILITQGINHEVYDMQVHQKLEDFFEFCDAHQPAFIGFSMMTFRYLHNYDLIRAIKKRYPQIKMLVGGPHASTFREKILEECEAVDVVVCVEGEEILVEICKDLPFSEIKGIIYRDGELLFNTGPRDLIEDLDQYAFPRLSKFNLDHYKEIPIVTSRGCPYSCIYCPIQTTIGKKWRPRRAETIVDELEYWVNKGYGKIQIEDDNFTLKKERVMAICQGIQERGLQDKLSISLTNGIRADKVDREMLTAMKESGFDYVTFGVESASNRMLKLLKKGEDIEDIEKAILIACDLDYDIELSFVLGAPGETREDLETSIRFATRFPVTSIVFFHLIPFPHTELYSWVEQNDCFRFKAPDFLNDASHWINEPLFTTPELDAEARRTLYKKINARAQRHTHRVVTRKIALKFAAHKRLPYFLVYFLLSILRNRMVKGCLEKTFLWKRMQALRDSEG